MYAFSGSGVSGVGCMSSSDEPNMESVNAETLGYVTSINIMCVVLGLGIP